MSYQRSVGRLSPTPWAAIMDPASAERLAALAANVFAWLIIVKLVMNH
jgi:hypothetical protein